MSIRRRLTAVFAGILLSVLVAGESTVVLPPNTASAQTPSKEASKRRDEWRRALSKKRLPKKGCFRTTYPSTEWTEVDCVPLPNVPMIPKEGFPPLVAGNGNDISVQAPSGSRISTAIGSFENVTNVTSVTSTYPASTGISPASGVYGLQLNTDFFPSAACSGGAAVCRGWEQFIYGNGPTNGATGIQYWLFRYNNTCPTGWNTYLPGGGETWCWRNAPGATQVPGGVAIGNLSQVSVSGMVTPTSDQVTTFVSGTAYAASGNNSVFASAGWTLAEFNVFGSCCGGQADFNNGASLDVRTRITYSGGGAPTCVVGGTTGETNNLNFGAAPPMTGLGPAVLFNENTGGNATASCASATTIGDTHLSTTHGLFYDYQASGDFVLAEVDPGFVVQARQVSAAPTWPNASVNHAIATQMGKTEVALCLNPTRLFVDGKAAEVGDALSAPGGVTINRRDNVYYIRSPNGDSVRATVNSGWIDALVGLGRWPTNVTGLLANADNDVSKIASRDGTVLSNPPFAFDDLYKEYGESWRVSPRESLLSVCTNGDVEQGNPDRFFFARDLDREDFDRTRALCSEAGVTGEAYLDACTLDVAVLGTDAAASVYVDARRPVLVANPVDERRGRDFPWWLLIVLVAVIVLLILWAVIRRRTA